MDEEFPRTALSINNRNELRSVLHLQSLYKDNKAKENPLKTIIEIMTSYFLEHTSNSKSIKSPSVLQNKFSQPRCAENYLLKNSLSEDNICGQSVPARNKIETYSYKTDEEIFHPANLSRRQPYNKSERSKTGATLDSSLAAEGEKKLANNFEDLKPPEQSLESRTAMREKLRARPGLIARGMMAGPTANSQEDSLKRRHLKRPSGISSTVQLRGEDSARSSLNLPRDDLQESKGTHKLPVSVLSSHSGSPLDRSKDHSPKIMFSPHTSADDEKTKHSAKGSESLFAKPTPERHRAEERRPMSGHHVEANEKNHHLNFFQKQTGPGSEKRAVSPKKTETQFLDCRKTPAPLSSTDTLELVDIEDEATFEEACRIPDPVTLHVLQVTSEPVDFCLARDLKSLLFGSSLSCFSEEWKVQSFTFNDIPQLKYGIVQKKGGPCGVLAAVQASVLRHLIFGDRNSNSNTGCLQTSEAHRTKCLLLALADILWRAGSSERAVVALSTGVQQFTPAGKYKADGILETLMLHIVTKFDDLLKFLQQNIYQFEAGPCGCILLTLSVILSRSIDQVRRDFDVITNHLIGAHGYCTQELVNLLLTGKAVSNVFNDVMELDSGNGNVTVLKGIVGRSEVGLLSLFEHYNVCQVGCYLKTPRFPVWLVCSESHFSVLFCLQKDLLGDWKMERQFDLYYYDGLASQQEEIRLTVDTSQPYVADKDDDLIPPLEHCIRTKWKGAVVNWNGTEPIL
ncbi:probable ubiquitin carboxyl-terminal hydrolase MINDY-4 isoform X2 [Hemicordylus capensis]|nr:probable ubiquitin carboxyl-terminal hydrolase MINDY-4 isoform X2 [Hemicordylus capensis]